VRLKQWKERERDTMGYSQGVRTAPLIDRIHRLMRIWSGGDRASVNTYIAEAALDADPLTQEVIQAIIELCTEREADERSKLEAISNHLSGLRPSASAPPSLL